MKNLKSLLIIGVIAVIVGGWVIGGYNTMLVSKAAVDQKWADVSVQLQRRFDLIPGLIETVKSEKNFEQETLTAVVEARSAWANAQNSGSQTEQVAAANLGQSALSRLIAVSEAYPTLQSNRAFQDFRIEFTGTENRIAVARRDYNEVVTSYNITVSRFPTVVFAKLFGYQKSELFTGTEGNDEMPSINFE